MSECEMEAEEKRSKRGWISLLDLMLLLSLLLVLVVFILDSWRIELGPAKVRIDWGWGIVLTPILLGAACILAHRRSPGSGWMSHKIFQQTISSISVFLAFFVLMECAFVLRGYEAFVPAMAVQGEAGAPQEVPGMIGDPELLFRFLPGTVFHGRTMNREGFPDADWEVKKPADRLRMMCLGDSCTAMGIPNYPEFIEEVSSNAFECLNLGTYGYSSEQGRRLWEMFGPMLQPDFVTIYFGWNDHWVADLPDYQRMKRQGSKRRAMIVNGLRQRRFFQYLVSRKQPSELPKAEAQGFRVSKDRYRENLEALIRSIREVGARPVLITAPRDTRLHRQVVTSGHVESVEAALELHDAYVAIVREVAETEKVLMVDAARLMNGAGREIFTSDGIHLTPEGRKGMAGIIFDVVGAEMGGDGEGVRE